jgi:hypothetical protein
MDEFPHSYIHTRTSPESITVMNLPLHSIQHNPFVTMEKDEEQEDFSPISQQPENDDSLMVE